MMPDRNEFIEGFNMGRTAGAEGRESRLKSGREWYNAGYNNGYDVGQCKCWDINAEGAFLEVITELLSQCAAGPWHDMDTEPPENEKLLVKLQWEDKSTSVYVATKYGKADFCMAGRWQIHPDDEGQLGDGRGRYPIVAWARINKPEEAEA